MAKVQFMLSIEELERDRMDALRIVMGVSRSEVGRRALARNGLSGLEKSQALRLGRLYALAERKGYAGWESYVRSVIENVPGRGPNKDATPALEDLEGEVTTPAEV